ncbi:hypothetical protein C943_03313 [Mariniradius saccharolyticus AK6]|uniref:Uncharacterized protein n=1 Tax=Mariniradius saccharolyticus AK6 TaxID=1239962 RepID=M7YBR1_9BACT|nr:hypothetical protein [Mariniradius saccharolyticus]EMS34626.1 hypothetical protein C943_03313 [Mariniradius saccharolyticus AK6]
MKEQAKKTAEQTPESAEIQILKDQVAALQALIEAQPKSLEEKIEYFKNKQVLMKRLATLDEYADSLATIVTEVDKESDADPFQTENFTLKVTKKQGYSSENDVLKMRNPKVIAEVIRFALGSIDTKRHELQNQINA